MELKALSKEQKQALFLIVLLTAGGLYALYRFVLLPTLGTFKDSGNELEELEAKLVRADVAMSQQARYLKELADTAKSLEETNSQYIPVLDNQLSWATENIYRSARSVAVDVESVSPLQSPAVPWATTKGTKEKEQSRVFVRFGVQVNAECGFFELIRLIEAIEQNNPLAQVSSIRVNSAMNTPERHNVSFGVEWPFWKMSTGPDMIRQPKTKTNGNNNQVPAGGPAT